VVSAERDGEGRQCYPVEPPALQHSLHRPDLLRAAGQGSRYVLIGKGITASLTFGTLIFVVRNLSPHEYGIYSLLLTIELYIGLFTANAFKGIFRRYLPEFRETGLSAFARKVVVRGTGVCFISSLGVVGLLLALFPLWAHFLHLEQYFFMTALFLAACVVHFLAALLVQSLAAFLLYRSVVAANVIQSVVRTAVVILVLMQGNGLLGVVIAEICSYISLFVASVAFYYFGVVRRETGIDRERAPTDINRRMRRYGIFHAINVSGVRIIGTETDILAVSLLFSSPLVGLYALAVRVVNSLENILPFRTLDDVIGPVFFRQYARSKNPGTLQAMVSFLTKVSALVLLPVVVTMLALGDILLGTVFGRQYRDVYGLASILSIALLFNLMRNPISLVLLALERNDIISLTRLAALYNLLGYVLFAPVFGIYGIAVATCSAAILQSVLLYYFGVKLAGVQLEWKTQGVILARFCLLGLFLVLCRYLNESLLVLVPAAVVGGIVTLWLCWSHGVFHASERQIVREFLGHVAGKPFWGSARMQPST